jgi:hypothetical protein
VLLEKWKVAVSGGKLLKRCDVDNMISSTPHIDEGKVAISGNLLKRSDVDDDLAVASY